MAPRNRARPRRSRLRDISRQHVRSDRLDRATDARRFTRYFGHRRQKARTLWRSVARDYAQIAKASPQPLLTLASERANSGKAAGQFVALAGIIVPVKLAGLFTRCQFV